jgi:alkylated DNA repair dioxygenase AlkB
MEKKLENFFFKLNPETKEEEKDKIVTPERVEFKHIPGLLLIKNFLTDVEEKNLIKEINSRPWLLSLKRRTQHYGYKYDYTSRNTSEYLGELPNFMDFVIERMIDEKLFESRPDQCIANEYEPGQGISPHIDVAKIFGNEVASISLGSDIIMDFYDSQNAKTSILLPRKSLLLLKDEARYQWKHGIAERKKDQLENKMTLFRKKRISLTFRTVKDK